MIKVQKANVQYTIDESKLGAYVTKGFKMVETATPEPSEDKPINKMNKAELLVIAAELSLDIPDGATVATLKELITAATEQ